MNLCVVALLSALCCLAAVACRRSDTVRVGSKEFTESVILGEIAAQLAGTEYPRVMHVKALGGTRVLWDALVHGEIDLYPEYTGTIVQEIFSGRHVQGEDAMAAALAEYGIEATHSLGFEDSYALGMQESVAQRLKIRTISDLRKYPDLRFGFSNEFMDRRDGWAGLRRHYQLPQRSVTGLEHQLAYRALSSGAIAVTDLYTTDADILVYQLRLLEDDKRFFPEYKAVFLYRTDLRRRSPRVLEAISRLQGRVSQGDMTRMNRLVNVERVAGDRVAADFLADRFSIAGRVENDSMFRRLAIRTREHLLLVSISLLAAIAISIPLGVLAFWEEKPGHLVLAAVGVIQTIPSLALIVFMIPLLGIGNVPAIVALFLYSLLPIVRNTHSGLADIPLPIRESAEALGLPRFARLRLVELPMASRAVLSGIKTSAVMNVGTATLGALIGAGGYGQPILAGIRLNNVGLILEGAVPAAVLALLVQGVFELLDRILVPKGLRIRMNE